MESFILEKDEYYQTQCGEIFFTTKSRLIFHCTLCDDKKFHGFNLFEIHIKEHIPMSNDVQMDRAVSPEHDAEEISENQFEGSTATNEIETLPDPISKEEYDLMSIMAIKTTMPEGSVGSVNSVEKKESSYEKLQIPAVVREVQTRKNTRSSLIPADERKHKCPVCELSFKQRQTMIIHLKRHSDNKDHKCPECDKGFYIATEFWDHMRRHKNESALNMKDNIPISFKDKEVDIMNMPQHGVKISENQTQRSSSTNEMEPLTVLTEKEENNSIEEALKQHEICLSEIKTQKRLHSETGIQATRITRNMNVNVPKRKTKHATETNEDLEIPTVVREVKTHIHPRSSLTTPEERKHKCPVCELGFKERHNMIHHLKRHSDNKDHKCPECDKRFYTAAEVRSHMRHHKNERVFLCNMCGSSFVRDSHLFEHLKRHANQRNYKCEVCEKTFCSKWGLTDHMAGHSNERPFSCGICAANFTRRMALKNHLKLHENKRAFKCKLCDLGFNQRAGLFSHMKTAHKAA